MHRLNRSGGLVLWLAALLLVPPLFGFGFSKTRSVAETAIHLKKPVLSYLVSVPRGDERLAREVGLDSSEIEFVRFVAKMEQQAVFELRQSGLAPAAFNRRAVAIAQSTDQRLRERLDDSTYQRLIAWVSEAFYGYDRVGPQAVSPTGYAYRVFATQFVTCSPETEDCHTPPGGEAHAAVPDKYVKFANLGWRSVIDRTGYEGADYKVRIRVPATGAVVEAPIYDVGPWNTDDNYWNAASDPTRPRRSNASLPQGMPASQAAYLYDHNGGKDQFGRLVLNPAGIDLTTQLAAQLGLKTYENAWVDVTFLWEAEPAPGKVWPGDTNADGLVDARDLLPIARHLGSSGSPRTPAETSWQAQPVDLGGWGDRPLAAHADADGSGTVDDLDLEVVKLNWGRSR